MFGPQPADEVGDPIRIDQFPDGCSHGGAHVDVFGSARLLLRHVLLPSLTMVRLQSRSGGPLCAGFRRLGVRAAPSGRATKSAFPSSMANAPAANLRRRPMFTFRAAWGCYERESGGAIGVLSAVLGESDEPEPAPGVESPT